MDTVRARNPNNSNFIQLVREEEFRSNTIDGVFLFTSEENPYRNEVDYTALLCDAIKDEKHREFLEQKRDQENCLNDEDLRDLGLQLRAAYVSKVRAAQSYEREERKKDNKMRRHQNYIVGLKHSRYTPKEACKILDDKKREMSTALKMDLLEQMAEKEAKREKARLDVIREKELADEARRKCEADLKREAELKKLHKERCKREIEQFYQLQNNAKLMQNQTNKEDSRRILEVKEKMEMEKQMAEKMKKDKLNHRIGISEEIGHRTYVAKKLKDEAAEQLIDLLVDEQNAKTLYQTHLKEIQKKQAKAGTRREMERAQEERNRQILMEQREKEYYYKKSLETLADTDRKLNLENEMRRAMIADYRKSVNESIDKREELRATAVKANLMMHESEIKEIERKKASVEATRHKMLRTFMPELAGFLHPNKLLKSDLPFLAEM